MIEGAGPRTRFRASACACVCERGLLGAMPRASLWQPTSVQRPYPGAFSTDASSTSSRMVNDASFVIAGRSAYWLCPGALGEHNADSAAACRPPLQVSRAQRRGKHHPSETGRDGVGRKGVRSRASLPVGAGSAEARRRQRRPVGDTEQYATYAPSARPWRSLSLYRFCVRCTGAGATRFALRNGRFRTARGCVQPHKPASPWATHPVPAGVASRRTGTAIVRLSTHADSHVPEHMDPCGGAIR